MFLSLQAMNFISFRSIGISLTYLPTHITRFNGKGSLLWKLLSLCSKRLSNTTKTRN